MFSIIAACDQKNGIAKNNQIPWHLSGDFKHFAQITKTTADSGKQNAVVMGRKTWESLPEIYKPLPDRLNVVLSRVGNGLKPFPTVVMFNSLDKALDNLSKNDKIEQIFVIGGSQVYAEAIKHAQCAKIYLTRVFDDFACDTFFSEIPNDFKLTLKFEIMEENKIKYQFLEFKRQKLSNFVNFSAEKFTK